MGNTKLAFNDDQKAVVERDIRKAYGAMNTLLDWVQKDSLSEDMKESLPKLIDNYMGAIKEAIGFTGGKSKREKEMTESIGQFYQNKIHDLERALESQQSIASIAANTEIAFKKIEKWWDVEGFHYIRDKSVINGGVVRLELGFMLDSFTSILSDTPVSDKKAKKTKLQYMKEKGFIFAPNRREGGAELLDNDRNRSLLESLIKDAFPSAKIWSHQNRLWRNNEEEAFILRYVEITIRDLNDIEQLTIEEKSFLFDEDE